MACIVSVVCGLGTLGNSVPYVVDWADDLDTVRQSAERVLTVADTILDRLDRAAVASAQEVDLDSLELVATPAR